MHHVDEIPYEEGLRLSLLGSDCPPRALRTKKNMLGVEAPFITSDTLASEQLYTFTITK